MAEMARYAVLNGPGDYEIREAPLPEIGDEEGILAVEACGVCGTDVEAYEGNTGGWKSELGELADYLDAA